MGLKAVQFVSNNRKITFIARSALTDSAAMIVCLREHTHEYQVHEQPASRSAHLSPCRIFQIQSEEQHGNTNRSRLFAQIMPIVSAHPTLSNFKSMARCPIFTLLYTRLKHAKTPSQQSAAFLQSNPCNQDAPPVPKSSLEIVSSQDILMQPHIIDLISEWFGNAVERSHVASDRNIPVPL